MRIIKATNSGFFGCLYDALRHIYTAEWQDEKWYIDWGKESLYYDESKGPNVWNNYFTQPLTEKADQDGFEVCGYQEIPEKGVEFRKIINKLIHKHIHLNGEIEAKWQRILDNWPTGNTVGVHIRYTDKFNWQAFNCPPESVPLELPVYINAVNQALNIGFDNVYLATDYAPAIDAFQRAYGSKLMYLKAPRSSNGSTIHRDMPDVGGFEKGLTVLLDAYSLANCDYLIRSCSNVSSFAMFKNLDMKQINLNELIRGETSEHPFGLFSAAHSYE